MSGHSKWSTIKRKKAVIDAKRGKIFTKIIKEITIAARMGGCDENSNPRLRQAIITAKAANMPADNMKRAIQKGTGELPGVNYEEVTYEGYGPAGVAILMEVITDNKNRIVAEIRHLMTKYGGNLGENGSVSWMFDKKGQIVLPASVGEEDEVLELSLENGAEDFEADEDYYTVYTEPADLMSVRDALEKAGLEMESAQLEMIPKTLQKVEGKEVERLMNLLEGLDDNDDINQLYTNMDVDEVDIEE
ncbi:MAG: YebC/PmpR family DNA-binding transcriptional regulator [Candidatus Marinimicrobia bacterium]|nr:YebC/PmpR family DNA-binding transcriptional regulator [Candidatus Neomarinimicrobiota bacterium]